MSSEFVASERTDSEPMDSEQMEAAVKGDAMSSDERLSTVADLLFGAQMQAQRTEMMGLEQKLVDRIDGLRDELNRQVRALELLIDAKANAAKEREDASYQRRKAVEGVLDKKIQELEESVRVATAQLDDKASEAESSLRAMVRSQCDALRETADKRHEEIMRLVNRSMGDLQRNKVDRKALAALLAPVVLELDPQGPAPGEEVPEE